ncbi:ParB N-terminal domain-containing protein [Pseudomonas sp. 8209]|uniref:ParB family protein n=1 Tax=Pseudomonas sp. 8209 TaxID=2967214 RepID=UPI00236337E5|nr:ParB family protein [Pseudomonas sp. 8209]MDD1954276.1 ParB N-terminal domain-containing protein [Pseudomonas sp. 8209]
MAATDLKAKLLAPGFTPTGTTAAMSDPIADTPLVLTVEQVLPWEDNPRTTRNPRYDELKESIRHRGLDTPPPVTRRPGEEKYRIRNGGNTRITILKELFQETGDERFQRINVLFRPWDQIRGEIVMLTGHLAEDLKGELKFIERAVAVGRAKALYEEESGETISQRELARRLSKDGYPISQSHISRMLDTLQFLLPAVPGLLYSGLGIDRITKIIALRKSALACWDKHYSNEGVDFEMLFQDVLAQFEGEAEEFLFQRFQDELIGTMKKSLQLGYEDILLEITQQQDKLRRSTPVVEVPSTGKSSNHPASLLGTGTASLVPASQQLPEATGRSPKPSQPPHQPAAPMPGASLTPEQEQERIAGHIASPTNLSLRVIETKAKVAALSGETLPDFNSNCLVAIPVQAGGLHPITDLWYIERQIDQPGELRNQVAQLAVEILESVNGPGDIQVIDGGIGFKYKQPETEVEVTATAQHTLTLLQSLSGAMAIALKMLSDQPDPASALAEFEFAAGLGQLLLGQPLSADQAPGDEGRLSDGALVKLFRIIRLARRLIDLEIEEFKRSSPVQDN